MVMVIFMARYMSDIGITNPCMYIRSGSVTAHWSIYIRLAEMWDNPESITSLSGTKNCIMHVNYVGIW